MSTEATDPKAVAASATVPGDASNASPAADKGKGKATEDITMNDDEEEVEEEEEDDDEDDEDEDEDDDEEDEADESMEVIDPTQILGRRTRGVKVDYTSKAALEKAGLKADDLKDDDEEMK
ncbi:hypothetical protein K525DRAFT_281364 [Schizophyllum commune Loenen D]|nr:hypothetical protein K525DRAFT_281364 [Schizophyllum commune Loenen D]